MWYGLDGAVKLATSSNAETGWSGSPDPDSNPTVFTPTCYSYSGPGTWCYGADPVLAPGPWDSSYIYSPSVVYDSAANNFKMFYSACDGSCNSTFTNSYGAVFPTGFATSPDGIRWTRNSGNPIIAPVPGGWENGDSTDNAGVLLVNGQLFVYYSGDTFTNQTCLESGSSSVPGTGTCPLSNNPFPGVPSHFLTYSIGGTYIIPPSSLSGELLSRGIRRLMFSSRIRLVGLWGVILLITSTRFRAPLTVGLELNLRKLRFQIRFRELIRLK